MPRHVLLNSGIPLDRPALGINRLCGSGFQAVVNSSQVRIITYLLQLRFRDRSIKQYLFLKDIETGAAKISLAGGTDNMSQAPYAVRNMRFGTTLGVNLQLEDTLWVGLTDTYCKLPMALTAEKLGEQFGIKREDVDNFALKSQHNWKAGNMDKFCLR